MYSLLYDSKALYYQVIWVCRLQLWGCRRRKVRRGVWTLALIFQKHFLNVCVKPNTSVQLFVNISITVRYFPTKYMHSEWAVNSLFVYDKIKTSKQVNRLKSSVDSLSQRRSSPNFFWIIVTILYSSYFSLKNATKFFLKILLDDTLQYSS